MGASPLDTDIKYAKGVGPARAKLLEDELGIRTVRDLLYVPPLRYIDRSRFYRIAELREDMPMVQVRGRFASFTEEGLGAKRRLTAAFTDGRSVMQVVWFAGIQYAKDNYLTGVEYVLLGKPGFYRAAPSMAHPEIERYDPDKPPQGLRGVYALSETLRRRGFTSATLPRIITQALERISDIPDTLPAEILERHRLMPLDRALRVIHNPGDVQELTRARERMKFEELFYLQLHILRYARTRNAALLGQRFTHIGDHFNRFYNEVLPFPLTGAQKRVIKEIRADMNTGRQMNRLLQGDVGSGKTMVAFLCMLIAMDNDAQAAIMAPTEILATQHFDTISAWAEKIGVRVRLLTGSTRAKARREIDAGLADGSVQILIGTHALLEEHVQFRNLGMVVIDEQHRFGVAQRARLWHKSRIAPHVLVMTATPIPRTLAMTVYGDLDVSVIDELPPGRKPVTTVLRYDSQRDTVYRGLYKEIAKGRQAYIVYPLISENEKVDLRSLEQGYEALCRTFPDLKVSYVHGKMKPAEKDRQMQLFATGQTQILVATTVIEVGVNVPNASVMVIENAERFGLSQLHQLRGRVGRGAEQSYCILMAGQKTGGTTLKRLEVMTSTTDGFIVSEADMKMRGPGDMEGTMQSGIPFTLQHASLTADSQIMALARASAQGVLNAHPELCGAPSVATADAPVPVSEPGRALLAAELARRFPSPVSWSRIS